MDDKNSLILALATEKIASAIALIESVTAIIKDEAEKKRLLEITLEIGEAAKLILNNST